MSRTLLALCLLGLLVATTMAKPHRGRGGRKGRKGGPKGVLYELTCESVNLERGGTYTRECDEGACNLGDLVYLDEEGTPVKTIKFCDALDVNETSLVAAAACVITDLEDSVLVNRTKPERPPRDDDSSSLSESHEDRAPPACELELDIVFFGEPAKAYFPNKPCGRKGRGRENDDDDDDDDDDDVEGGESSPPEQTAEGGEQETGGQTGRQRSGGRRGRGGRGRGRRN